MKRFIVASASPRRKEILQNAGYIFEIIPSDADETVEKGLSAEETVEQLAFKKATAVSEKNADAVVFGCDTVVVSDGEILGKPKDSEDAFRMLKMLSGKTHKVLTGVCVRDSEKCKVFSVATDVTFFPLSDETIESYIATKEPDDKAGAYGIQGFGSVLVKEIKGDYLSVVGLPLSETARVLTSFGIKGKVEV